MWAELLPLRCGACVDGRFNDEHEFHGVQVETYGLSARPVEKVLSRQLEEDLAEMQADPAQVDLQLWQSVRQGNLQGLAMALRRGASPDVPLGVARQLRAQEEAQGFLGRESTGTSVAGALEDSMTPLMSAARAGSVPGVRHLLEAKASVGKVESEGWTALHFAATSLSLEVCKLLLDARADSQRSDVQGRTPLQIAQAEDGFGTFFLKLKKLVESS